jgi:hypothetical protein
MSNECSVDAHCSVCVALVLLCVLCVQPPVVLDEEQPTISKRQVFWKFRCNPTTTKPKLSKKDKMEEWEECEDMVNAPDWSLAEWMTPGSDNRRDLFRDIDRLCGHDYSAKHHNVYDDGEQICSYLVDELRHDRTRYHALCNIIRGKMRGKERVSGNVTRSEESRQGHAYIHAHIVRLS